MPELSEVFGRTTIEKFTLDQITYQDGTPVEDPFTRNMKKEIEFAASGFPSYQTPYIVRLRTNAASRRIVESTFNWSSIKDGVEFGCGMWGWFYNHLLPESAKTRWRQYDINPKAVAYNSAYTQQVFGREPSIKVGNIYDMPMEDESVDVIAGYNSWDSIGFFEKAVAEVDRCLESGGHFIHYQEAIVPDKVFIIEEAKKRMVKGLDPSMKVEVFRQRVEHPEIPGVYRIDGYYVAMDTMDYGRVRFADYMTKHIADLFEREGYEIVLAEEKGCDLLVERKALKNLAHLHDFEFGMEENSFMAAYGKSDMTLDKSVPDGYIRQRSFKDVLVVQKPE